MRKASRVSWFCLQEITWVVWPGRPILAPATCEVSFCVPRSLKLLRVKLFSSPWWFGSFSQFQGKFDDEETKEKWTTIMKILEIYWASDKRTGVMKTKAVISLTIPFEKNSAFSGTRNQIVSKVNRMFLLVATSEAWIMETKENWLPFPQR